MADIVPAAGIIGVNIKKAQKGSATIQAHTNSVTVSHSLGSALIRVTLGPTNNFASQGGIVQNKAAATFDIAFAFGATQPSDATFDWIAAL